MFALRNRPLWAPTVSARRVNFYLHFFCPVPLSTQTPSCIVLSPPSKPFSWKRLLYLPMLGRIPFKTASSLFTKLWTPNRQVLRKGRQILIRTLWCWHPSLPQPAPAPPDKAGEGRALRHICSDISHHYMSGCFSCFRRKLLMMLLWENLTERLQESRVGSVARY